MIAAAKAKDANGLSIIANFPKSGWRPGTASSDVDAYSLPSIHDMSRIEAITLGAIVALVNGQARVEGDVPIKLGADGRIELDIGG